MALAPEALPLLPAAVVALGAAVALLQRPTAGLVTALVLSAGLTGYDAVSQVGEVLFVLYSGAYLALWYGGRLLASRPIVLSATDAFMAVLVFGGLTFGVIAGVLAGANGTMLAGEARSFAMLLFYFPVREACESERDGATNVTAAFIVVGLVVVGWNVWTTLQAFASADQLWKIIDVRSAYGETTLTASLMLSLALLLTSVRPRDRASLMVLVSVLLIGFILTKSRGFWAAGALGMVAILGVLQRRDRKRLVVSGAVVVAVGVGVALLVFGDYAQLMAVGLAKRFLTLGSATTTDASLINRFHESAAVWDRVVANPVLGYGFGVPFGRYDIIYGGTLEWSFVHNGFLGTWYKIGLWGLGLVVAVWASGIWRAARAARASNLTDRERALAAAAVGVLVALAVAANTSTPFMLADQTLALSVALGLAHGLSDRAAAPPAP
ncbi:MAG TPA: O-antigen ligase family protein [Rubricoccaceae bacterium]